MSDALKGTVVKPISGDQAVRIMVEEIGEVIGAQRLREFDRKVRARMAAQGIEHGGTGQDWIDAMAHVIVKDGDNRADVGFRKGIRRIRAASEQ